MRWSLGIIIAFTVSLVVSALMGPSPAAARMKLDSAHTHSAVPHQQTPAHSHDDAKIGSACCMLACTPVVLAVSSPMQVRLRVTECASPVLARIAAVHRGEPPFHPPRRA